MNKLIIYALLALCLVAPIVALVSGIKVARRASQETIQPNPKLDDLELSISNLSREVYANTREASNALQSSVEMADIMLAAFTNKPMTVYIDNPAITIQSEYEPTVTRTAEGWEIRFNE